MNKEALINIIKNLGKSDFDALTAVVLTKVFDMKVINVDGTGDGGSDFRSYEFSQKSLAVAIQATVQKSNWEKKALEDARKVKKEFAPKRFYFIMSNMCASSRLINLENKIEDEIKIPCKCFGASELASFIIENNILNEVFHAINISGYPTYRRNATRKERLFHAYFTLSNDKESLRNEICQNTILFILSSKKNGLTIEELTDNVVEEMSLPQSFITKVTSQIDHLLQKNSIAKKRQLFFITDKAKNELLLANSIYNKEFNDLMKDMKDVLEYYHINIDKEKCSELSFLMSKCFLNQQILTARKSSLSFTMTRFGRELENSNEILSDLLFSLGAKNDNIYSILEHLDLVAGKSPLIKKMSAALTYYSLECSDKNNSCVILGATDWKDITVILDASVAIPYITSSFFKPSTGRFSKGSVEAIDTLKKKGSKIAIPQQYLDECAAHLIGAFQYCVNLEGLERHLQFSENGYVSHYYHMKNSGIKVHNTLKQYIDFYSTSATNNNLQYWTRKNKVIDDLINLFGEIDVHSLNISKIDIPERKDLEIEYTELLHQKKISKEPILIDHDIEVLAFLRLNTNNNNKPLICLTWDGVMIDVGTTINRFGWVVSPVNAADIVQSSLPLDDSCLRSLAHVISAQKSRADEIAGRIIDKIMHYVADSIENWELKSATDEFISEFKSRIDTNQKVFDVADIDKETIKFLNSLNINTSKNLQNASR